MNATNAQLIFCKQHVACNGHIVLSWAYRAWRRIQLVEEYSMLEMLHSSSLVSDVSSCRACLCSISTKQSYSDDAFVIDSATDRHVQGADKDVRFTLSLCHLHLPGDIVLPFKSPNINRTHLTCYRHNAFFFGTPKAVDENSLAHVQD